MSPTGGDPFHRPLLSGRFKICHKVCPHFPAYTLLGLCASITRTPIQSENRLQSMSREPLVREAELLIRGIPRSIGTTKVPVPLSCKVVLGPMMIVFWTPGAR